MAKRKKTVKPKKVSKRSLDPLRQQLDVLVREANRRVRALVRSGLTSRALETAQRSFKKLTSRDEVTENGNLFKSNLKRRTQINREFARVNEFLGDITSTVKGVRKNIDISTSYLKSAFGGQWYEKYGVNYDKSRIDEELAKQAFSIYRKLSEEFGGWERVAGIYHGVEGLIGYGSEILINSIYDMVKNDYSELTIMDIGRDMINKAERRFEDMAEKMVGDYDYGNVFSDEQAIEKRRWILNKIRMKKGEI